MTVTEIPAELTPASLRFTALFGISMGFTAAEVRTRPGDTAQKSADKQIADEIDLMTACGYTRQVAAVVLDERGRANRGLHPQRCGAEQARREVRAVAEAMLRARGPAAVRICRRIAGQAAIDGDSELSRSFAEFADAAEELIAECEAGPLVTRAAAAQPGDGAA
ncbi:MAG TPA: hypothetical protein VFB06_29415 [Streptosporangiaceae bacterium]|nr:hypothetical protein [Streptosporangiaceae bacterium]